MSKLSREKFEEILKNDGYIFVVTSKEEQPIDINFPNLPKRHRDEFEEWRHEILHDSIVIRFEYNGSSYKLLVNMGDADCNDGNFGALFDANDSKILDLLSTGDMETTIESLQADATKISNELSTKLSPYIPMFEAVLPNYTELEYVVFKILLENRLLYDVAVIDERLRWQKDLDEEEIVEDETKENEEKAL